MFTSVYLHHLCPGMRSLIQMPVMLTLFMTDLCFMGRKDNVTRCMYTFGWSCTLHRCVGSGNHTPPWSPSSSLKSEATLWRHCRRRVRGPPWSDTSHTAPCMDTRPFQIFVESLLVRHTALQFPHGAKRTGSNDRIIRSVYLRLAQWALSEGLLQTMIKKLVPLSKVILGKLKTDKLIKKSVFMNLKICCHFQKSSFVPVFETIPHPRILL